MTYNVFGEMLNLTEPGNDVKLISYKPCMYDLLNYITAVAIDLLVFFSMSYWLSCGIALDPPRDAGGCVGESADDVCWADRLQLHAVTGDCQRRQLSAVTSRTAHCYHWAWRQTGHSAWQSYSGDTVFHWPTCLCWSLHLNVLFWVLILVSYVESQHTDFELSEIVRSRWC